MLDNYYEKLYWEKELLTLGIDEAGRGPLAGPLVVAGVVFPLNYQNNDINDSKELSKFKREGLYLKVINDALFYQIEVVNVDIIDSINILEATKEANLKIALASNINHILTDAINIEIRDKNIISLIKGDKKSISIAGASILAKVVRDQIMEYYDFLYPNYLFYKHKGYGTKKHIEILKELGPSPIHRKSFKVKSLTQLEIDL